MLETADVQSGLRRLSQRRDAIHHTLAERDYVLVSGYQIMEFILREPGVNPLTIDAFARSWDGLTPDGFMADGGKYRTRRHATMVGDRTGGAVLAQPHQPHFQALAHNTLNGGIERHYDPIHPEIIDGPVMTALLQFATSAFGALAPFHTWHIEIHQFRITAVEGGGKPTPEGTHHDGVNYVLMTLLDRRNVWGGLTSIHRNGHKIAEFALEKMLDTALVNDERVAHGVTPIEAVHADKTGYRDVLVITFRRKLASQDTERSAFL
ncbi:MAG: 2OG-Fe dioxygenase family protein [Acidiphilium sp.]|nr:2OG-Fe dioxygenase family protein [Acidiphilium sp.]MDD4937096.1 2OG-Fe dioxygenase family protein [Acidiphilium sp.]